MGSNPTSGTALVLADPDHEDQDHLTQWVGGRFDPTFFDLVAANVALQQLR